MSQVKSPRVKCAAQGTAFTDAEAIASAMQELQWLQARNAGQSKKLAFFKAKEQDLEQRCRLKATFLNQQKKVQTQAAEKVG
jgi:flagella basal body P-ring formation protein FlgA